MTNELKSQPFGNNSEENETIYVLEDLRLGRNDTKPLVLTNVWVYAITAKIIPCFLISVFGTLLFCQMKAKIKQRKDFLKVSASNHNKLHEHSRTTKMLITVIVLFLVTELPQGFLIAFSACKENFFHEVYMPLGDVMDICALVNNAINFILYCTMSTKFRQTFLKLYCSCHWQSRHHSRKDVNGLVIRVRLDSFSNNNDHGNDV